MQRAHLVAGRAGSPHARLGGLLLAAQQQDGHSYWEAVMLLVFPEGLWKAPCPIARGVRVHPGLLPSTPLLQGREENES